MKKNPFYNMYSKYEPYWGIYINTGNYYLRGKKGRHTKFIKRISVKDLPF